MTDDESPQAVDKPVDEAARRSLDALNDPALVRRRVDRSRSYGVGGLLPPLADLSPMDPEVQQRLFPGVPRGPYTLGDAVEDEEVTEARERVRHYIETMDTRAIGDDVIHRAYPPGGCGIDAVPLHLADLRLLVGPDREDGHGQQDRQA